MQITRQEALELLNTQEVYDAIDLKDYFVSSETRYITLAEILAPLGVSEEEVK